MPSTRDTTAGPPASRTPRPRPGTGGDGPIGDFVTDTTTAYARAVLAGEILAGRPVRLACERHIRDLETGHQRGLRFSVKRAERAMKVMEFLQLAEGEHAGKPFIPQPSQRFILGSLYGWLGADGFRRFRTAYIEQGKGNGKTPLGAAVGVKGLVFDQEPGAEIYAAATMRDQARIAFTDAEKMITASPFLAARVHATQNNIAVLETNSFFRPVSSEGRGLDGKRVHVAIIDELHEHKSPVVVDKMSAGTKGRRQAIIFEITNSGYDRNSVCWHHHEYSLRVLDGTIQDDSWFAYVCALDVCDSCRAKGKDQPQEGCPTCDDWRDESTWIKANPLLDVSITRKYLRQQVTEAIGMPSKANTVKRLNFCIWTEGASRWLDAEVWNACGRNGPIDEAALEGRDAFMSLDLASTGDFNSACLAFHRTDDERAAGVPRIRAIWRFWIPRGTFMQRTERERAMLQPWIDDGYIKVTEGDTADYDVIRDDCNALAKRFAIKECAYDPWNATQLATQLQSDGFPMVEFRQRLEALNEPTKTVEKLVTDRQLDHGGNPVATWMVSNVAITENAEGNKKPNKAASTDRIDGAVTLIMSVGRATVQPEEDGSVYEERGILEL